MLGQTVEQESSCQVVVVIISNSHIRRFQLIIIDLKANTPVTLEICGSLGQ